MNRLQVIAPGGPGAPYYSDFYFDAGAGADAVTQANGLQEFWEGMAQIVNIAYDATFDGVVQNIDVATGNVTGVETVPPWVSPGATNTEQLPPANQGLLQLHTGVYTGGRELRGRKNLWGPGEGDSTNGVPSLAYVTAANFNGQFLIDVDQGWCVYSPTHHIAAPITSATCANYWAVLRSRRD